MKKKLTILILIFCLGLSACGKLQGGFGKLADTVNPLSSSDPAGTDSPGKNIDDETEDKKEPDNAQASADTVPVYLLAESVIYYDGKFSERRVYERDCYGNISKVTNREENNENVISTQFTANVTEGDRYYYTDSPYRDVYYSFEFNEEGKAISISGRGWTLSYSEEDGSTFRLVRHEKHYSTDTGYSYTYVTKYDDNFRLVERAGYDYGSDVVKYVTYNTYDDEGKLIQSHEIHYGHGTDYDNPYTSFCEMNRPLISYTSVMSRGTYYQDINEYICECTYDSSGNILTEVHKNKETGNINVNVNYAYAYDSQGHMIEMTKIHKDYNEYFEYDAEGNQIGYRRGSGQAHDVYKAFDVVNDKLVLALLALQDELE